MVDRAHKSDNIKCKPSETCVSVTRLTKESLKSLLQEPKDTVLPKPWKELGNGEVVPLGIYEEVERGKLEGIPLQEIDPAYRNSKTFIVIGSFQTLHRYSGKDALEILGPLNPVRRWFLWFTTHWIFSLVVTLVVILDSLGILLGVQDDKRVGNLCRYTFALLYILECLLKILTQGLLKDPFTYIRDPWNYLDPLVIFSTLIPSAQEYSILLWSKVLKIIQVNPELRRWFGTLFKCILKLAPALMFLSLFISVQALIGKVAYLGAFTRRCVSYSDYLRDLATMGSNETVSWRDFAKSRGNWYSDEWCMLDNEEDYMECLDAEDDYECIQGAGDNPDNGLTNFDSWGWAMVQVCRGVRQDYLEGLVDQLLRATDTPVFTTVYFVTTFIFGTFLLAALAYALMGKYLWKQFKTKFQNGPKKKVEDPEDPGIPIPNAVGRVSLSPSTSTVDHQLQGRSHPRQVNLRRRASRIRRVSRREDPAFLFITRVVGSLSFEVFITSVVLMDVASLMMQGHKGVVAYYFWKWMPRIAVIIYTMESLMKIICLKGPIQYFSKPWNIFDFLIMMDLYLQILWKKYPLRFPLRMFKLTPRWDTLKNVLQILLNCLKSLWGLIGVLLSTVAYLALVGTAEFKNSNSPVKSVLHSSLILFRSWGLGESYEFLGQCVLNQGPDGGGVCILYFSLMSLAGILIVMGVTIAIVFVVNKTLEEEDAKGQCEKFSVMMTMFCYPYVWYKTHGKEKVADKVMDHLKVNANILGSPGVPGPSSGSGRIYTVSSSSTCNLSSNKDEEDPFLRGSRSGGKVVQCSPPIGGSQVLKGVSIFIIIVFSLVLILDNIPNEDDIDVESVIYAVDLVFTVFILIMLGYRMIWVSGIVPCLTSPGWVFDALVILEMIINILSGSHPTKSHYPTFYFFRSLRPFMLISRVEMLETVLRGFLRELKFLWNYLAVYAYLLVFFAVIGINVVGNMMLDKCVDPTELTSSSSTSSLPHLDKTTCLASNYTWIEGDSSIINFQDLGDSLSTLGLLGRRRTWMVSTQDWGDSKEFLKFHGFAVTYLSSFLIMVGVLLGVLYYNLNKFSGIFLTKHQAKNVKGRIPPQQTEPSNYPKPEGSQYRMQLYNVVTTNYFDFAVILLISTDLVLLGMIDAESEYWSNEQSLIPNLRLGIFILYIVEACAKLLAWGKSYFFNGWNQFDFFVVVLGLTEFLLIELDFPIFFNTSIPRLLRILRIFQFLPFLKRVSTYPTFLHSLNNLSPLFRNLLMFYAILMYSYALLGLKMFGHLKVGFMDGNLNDYLNFQTVGSSLRIVLLLAWGAGVDEILLVLRNYDCSNLEDTNCYDYGFWGILFVYSFIFMNFLVWSNLYLLVILEVVETLKIVEEDKCSNTNYARNTTTTNRVAPKLSGKPGDVEIN